MMCRKLREELAAVKEELADVRQERDTFETQLCEPNLKWQRQVDAMSREHGELKRGATVMAEKMQMWWPVVTAAVEIKFPEYDSSPEWGDLRRAVQALPSQACSVDPMSTALAQVQAEFPDDKLHQVKVEFRLGYRSDSDITPPTGWRDHTWSVQAGNDHEHGDTIGQAVAKVRKYRKIDARIPDVAARVAALLEELPEEGFARMHASEQARIILDKKRRRA